VTDAQRKDDAELAQQAARLIGLCGARLHVSGSRAVQRKYRLLFWRFHRHEAHIGARHRLTDRLGIVAVVLVGLHIRLDELRRHQSYFMPQRDELARPMVRTAAGFHADEARGQVGEEGRHLAALELLAQHRFSVLIHTVNLKHALCQIDTHCRNLHDGRSFSLKWW
jgi:hypothetical protein